MTKGDVTYAEIKFKKLRETGSLTMYPAKGVHPIVRRKGLKGWVLLPAGAEETDESIHPVATICKPSMMRSRFRITYDNASFSLVRTSFVKSTYEVRRLPAGYVEEDDDEENGASPSAKVDSKAEVNEMGTVVGSFRREKLWRHKYLIDFDKGVPELLPALSVWFLTMIDRRDSAAAGASVSSATAAHA